MLNADGSCATYIKDAAGNVYAGDNIYKNGTAAKSAMFFDEDAYTNFLIAYFVPPLNPVGNVLKGKTVLYPDVGGGSATYLTDGNVDGNWGRSSCAHTGYTNIPYWTVDMGASTLVHEVAVYDR
jgi:hypothetical protein